MPTYRLCLTRFVRTGLDSRLDALVGIVWQLRSGHSAHWLHSYVDFFNEYDR